MGKGERMRKPTKKELKMFGSLLELNMMELKIIKEKVDSLIILKTNLEEKELLKS